MKCTLWFDVEQRYKTISPAISPIDLSLWFDVEQRYKTIGGFVQSLAVGCGLM